MDLDVHGLAGALRRDDDFFDHAAQALEDEIAGLAFAQTVQVHAQLFNKLAVAFGGRRVKDNRLVIGFEGFGFRAQFGAYGLQLPQAIKHPISRGAFGKQVDEFLDLLVELGKAIGNGFELAGFGGRKLLALEVVVRNVSRDHFRIG